MTLIIPVVSRKLPCTSPTFPATELREKAKDSEGAHKAGLPKLQKELPFLGTRGSPAPSLELGVVIVKPVAWLGGVGRGGIPEIFLAQGVSWAVLLRNPRALPCHFLDRSVGSRQCHIFALRRRVVGGLGCSRRDRHIPSQKV